MRHGTARLCKSVAVATRGGRFHQSCGGRELPWLYACLITLAADFTRSETCKAEERDKSTAGNTAPQPSVDLGAHGVPLNVRVSPWLAEKVAGINQSEAREAPSWDEKATYVIVGGGVTGTAALRSLLLSEPSADVIVISKEQQPQSGEPAMSDSLTEAAAAAAPTMSRFRRGRARVRPMWGRAVVTLDSEARILVLEDGTRVHFDKCLIATGTGPHNVPAKHVDSAVTHRVSALGSIHDRERLADMILNGLHVTIVGSSWAAVELASHLSDLARKQGFSSSVTLIFPEQAPLAKQLPRYLAGLLLRRLERRGVEVISHTAIKYVGRSLKQDQHMAAAAAQPGEVVASPVRVYLTSKFEVLDSSVLLTDHVVVVGSSNTARGVPTIRFENTALEVDEKTGGIVVNNELMASSSVFVAGDAAHFPCSDFGRMTVRSADHAYHSGYVAGLNMTGRSLQYSHLPVYFGAIPRLGVRAAFIGVCDAANETHAFWWKPQGAVRRKTVERTATKRGEEQQGLLQRVYGTWRPDKKPSSALQASPAPASGSTGRSVGVRKASARRDQGIGDADTSESIKAFTPVNGTGVVFYLDSNGSIRGMLIWGLPPPSPRRQSHGKGGSSLETIDDVLAGIIDRAKGTLVKGLRSGASYKYDINSRPDTLTSLRQMAVEIMGPAAIEQLGGKGPMYSYAGARILTRENDEALWQITNNSKSMADIIEAAYESATKGITQGGPGTSSNVPFPFKQ